MYSDIQLESGEGDIVRFFYHCSCHQ